MCVNQKVEDILHCPCCVFSHVEETSPRRISSSPWEFCCHKQNRAIFFWVFIRMNLWGPKNQASEHVLLQLCLLWALLCWRDTTTGLSSLFFKGFGKMDPMDGWQSPLSAWLRHAGMSTNTNSPWHWCVGRLRLCPDDSDDDDDDGDVPTDRHRRAVLWSRILHQTVSCVSFTHWYSNYYLSKSIKTISYSNHEIKKLKLW